jgi:hypothetical protein
MVVVVGLHLLQREGRYRPRSPAELSSQDLFRTFGEVRVTGREASDKGLPRCSLLLRALRLRNELQLYTIADLYANTPTLQLVSQRTVDNNLLGCVRGGSHIDILDRRGVLAPKSCTDAE